MLIFRRNFLKRKDIIIEKSLELLNNLGSNKVSTNLIARELDISLGNLYYYFRNKEEIILEIFNNFIGEIDYFWELNSNLSNFNYIIDNLVNLSFLLFKKYKILYFELLSLSVKDVNLKKEYIKLLESQKNNIKLIAEKAIKDGYLQEFVNEEIEDFFEAFWFSFSLWFSLKDIENIKELNSEEYFFKLKKWVYLSINGYLSVKGRKLLKESFGG